MPLLWVNVPATTPQDQRPRMEHAPVQVSQTFGELVVTAQHTQYDPVNQIYRFDGGVIARFGITSVEADQLTIDAQTKHGHATGHVMVRNPDATLEAEDLDFSWDPNNQFGSAKNVHVMAGHILIDAATADLTQTQWTFTNVSITQCPDFYWIRSPKVIVVPGKYAKLTRPTLYAFGKRAITVDDQRINLDRRTQGIPLPSLSYSGGSGIGISWSLGMLVADRVNLLTSFDIQKGSLPGYGLQLTYSPVTKPGEHAVLTPSSDLEERFSYGYFDNVGVDTPHEEHELLNSVRDSYSVGTLWNQNIVGRKGYVSKPYELAYENGGSLGKYGYLGIFRFQNIYEVNGPRKTRFTVTGAVELPSTKLTPQLSTLNRIDTEQYFDGEHFGWVRGQFGLVYEANARVRLAAALVGTVQAGHKTFDFDRPFDRNGANLRVDFDLGPTKLSFLQKFDTDLKWYDREIAFSQISGCFEPFIVQRQFPRSFVFGIRLRTGNFGDLIYGRKPDSETATTEIK